ncbi:hypothetical protein L596_025345 [Steinernema carpocapsae]|uniref:Uncharacterized protein n=1 Tax=Steinernema carpocapsae TaxID=34508 RepID=A0A4U5M7I5_STECR|nr:hypothetical protein L596_025345 [Steinernema carpocapsae]
MKAKYSNVSTSVWASLHKTNFEVFRGEYRADNFFCLVYKWSYTNKYFLANKGSGTPQITVDNGGKAYWVYRASQSQSDYQANTAKLANFESKMGEYMTGPVDLNREHTMDDINWFFEMRIKPASDQPMAFFIPVSHYLQFADNMGYSGAYWPVNGNSNAVKPYTFDVRLCVWFLFWPTCDDFGNLFKVFIGL